MMLQRRNLTSFLVNRTILNEDVILSNILDWLHDCNIVHTPTTISHSSQHQSFHVDANDLESFPEGSRKDILQEALRETGFTERIWATASFSAMQPQSRMNFLCQIDKMIEHVVTIYAPNDYTEVRSALVKRSIKKMKQIIEVKFGYVARYLPSNTERIRTAIELHDSCILILFSPIDKHWIHFN